MTLPASDPKPPLGRSWSQVHVSSASIPPHLQPACDSPSLVWPSLPCVTLPPSLRRLALPSVSANELGESGDAYNVGPLSQEERDEHWAIILDAGRDNLHIPRRLEWSATPRTREYLNAADGPGYAVQYFAPLYPPYRDGSGKAAGLMKAAALWR